MHLSERNQIGGKQNQAATIENNNEMNAVILYDEYRLGTRASAMLCEAARRADVCLSWKINSWPTDLLLSWPATDDALNDAVSAHLIVIAIRKQAELSLRLLNWLETWAARREIQDAALAVFDGENIDLLSACPSPELAHFAKYHGLCFIRGSINPNDSNKDTAELRDFPHERQWPRSVVRMDISARKRAGNNRACA
jgi:hypothetical protein